MANTKSDTIREVTQSYLKSIDLNNPPSPSSIEEEILKNLYTKFNKHNAENPAELQWRYPDHLFPAQIADILLALFPIVNIACAGIKENHEYDILSIYRKKDEDKGIYVSAEHDLTRLAKEFCYTITFKETQEVINIIRNKAPRRERCSNKDLIAVNNGIFNYKTKKLIPFNPDLVFTAKSKVNYNENATNVTIHNPDDNSDWNVESWMNELSDDPEIVNLLWEILGAIIRPNVSWNKSAWFYSNTGNNGKGTLCELMRQLCGYGSYASIPLSDFCKDFMLEPLIRATAIITDENNVGTYIDKAANLKAIITNDVIQINRKFKTPIAYKFYGFMVQCLNEMPKIKDKSDSFYRRQIFVPFTKCFTGHERKYIKNDYLKRPEVLEYVLCKVLNMNYYSLSEPKACREALEEYKEFNDPVRQFVDEILPQTTWDLLPFAFLYDMYKAWFRLNMPNGTCQGKTTFMHDLTQVIQTNPDWDFSKNQVYTMNHMNGEEPLAGLYKLSNWQNFVRQNRYRGLLRITNQSKQVPFATASSESESEPEV